MTGEVVNLRRARKARARAATAANADSARALHGRTLAQKKAEAAEIERARRTLDGARRDPTWDETRQKPDQNGSV